MFTPQDLTSGFNGDDMTGYTDIMSNADGDFDWNRVIDTVVNNGGKVLAAKFATPSVTSTPAPVTPAPSQNITVVADKGKPMSTGAMIGIIGGGLAVVGLIIFLAVKK